MDALTQDLAGAIAEYNASFKGFKYDLPEYWAKRDRYGLPFKSQNLPFFAGIANFFLVEIHSTSFPWGEIYVVIWHNLWLLSDVHSP